MYSTALAALEDKSFLTGAYSNSSILVNTSSITTPDDQEGTFWLREDCTQQVIVIRVLKERWIEGVEISDHFNFTSSASIGISCEAEIVSPEGTSLMVDARCSRRSDVDKWRAYSNLKIRDGFSNRTVKDRRLSCGSGPDSMMVTSHSNSVFMSVLFNEQTQLRSLKVTFKVKVMPRWALLPVVLMSPFSGYLASLGSENKAGFPVQLSQKGQIRVPEGLGVMLSFPKFYVECTQFTYMLTSDFIELYATSNNGTEWTLFRECGYKYMTPITLDAPRHVTIKIVSEQENKPPDVKMLFSFHKPDSLPQAVSKGVFNCSVDYYSTFRQHLDCNLEKECEDGEDESGECPFSSPACEGKVASRNKCFFLVRQPFNTMTFTWNQAENECMSRGGRLASVRTQQELEDLLQLQSKVPGSMYVGLKFSWSSKPFLYRRLFRWADKTVVYFLNHVLIDLRHFEGTLAKHCVVGKFLNLNKNLSLIKEKCFQSSAQRAVCETDTHAEHSHESDERVQLVQEFIQLHTSNVTASSLRCSPRRPPLVSCPAQHVTHVFLSCDPASFCGHDAFRVNCPLSPVQDCSETSTLEVQSNHSVKVSRSSTVAMFVCDDEITTLHYTMVCDFRADCPDTSDERFCWHPPCAEFLCGNGQCVSHHLLCNNVENCLDGSDEVGCQLEVKTSLDDLLLTRDVRSIVDWKHGHVKFSDLDMTGNGSCPDTHYRCPGQLVHCLPVYTRCNGYFDCIDRQDELGCENVTCPGYYRCRGSSMCLHLVHLCDGWPQCPQHDDEWLCEHNVSCPAGCVCQGAALLCDTSPALDLYPHLRYLSVSYANVSLSALEGKAYLIYLNLTSCYISVLPVVRLDNLQVLDLSGNRLPAVNLTSVQGLPNLKVLRLSRNPLIHLTGVSATILTPHPLKSLDLSHTYIEEIESTVLSSFTQLTHLNLSFSQVTKIGQSGFQGVPSLSVLDMSGCPLVNFPLDLFTGLTKLADVYSPSYQMCCQGVLPAQRDNPICVSSEKLQVSSCENLLRSKLFQALFFILSIVCVVANVVCMFICCVRYRKSSRTASCSVFVINLNAASILMGIYTAVIAISDEVYRGMYVYFETSWKHSVLCRTAGFLCLTSHFVSMITVFILTVDSCLKNCLPRSKLHITTSSSIVICLLSWLAGLVLAATPLWPFAAHWQIYSQSAICITVPTAWADERDGYSYSFTLYAALPFLVSLLTTAGQIAVFTKVKREKRSATVLVSRMSQEVLDASRMFHIAMFDSVCWLVLSALLLLSTSDFVSGHFDLSVAVMVMSLSLPAALNPALFITKTVRDEQRRKAETRLLRMLKFNAKRQAKKTSAFAEIENQSIATENKNTSNAADGMDNSTINVKDKNGPTVTLTSTDCMSSFNTSAESGTILWKLPETRDDCHLHLYVPEGLYIEVFDMEVTTGAMAEENTNMCSHMMTFADHWPLSSSKLPYRMRWWHRSHFPVYYSATNQVHFLRKECPVEELTLRFNTTTMYLKNTLAVRHLDAHSGFITSPGYAWMRFGPDNVDAKVSLMVPNGSSLMISFERLNASPTQPCNRNSHLQLSVEHRGELKPAWKECDQINVSAEVYHTAAIALHYSSYLSALGFLMKFSFHSQSHTPHKLDNALFNCSVDYYSTFRQHLDCNLEKECEDGEDETGECSFSSPACEGKVASRNKCFFPLLDNGPVPKIGKIRYFDQLCQKQGGSLAVFHTDQQVSDIYKVLGLGKIGDRCGYFATGVVYGETLLIPNQYRNVWRGHDNSILYNYAFISPTQSSVLHDYYNGEKLCQVLTTPWGVQLHNENCQDMSVCGVLCQVTARPAPRSVSYRNPPVSQQAEGNSSTVLELPGKHNFTHRGLTLVRCPNQHWTHLFLRCDLASNCGSQESFRSCTHINSQTDIEIENQENGKVNSWISKVSIPMFVCANGLSYVHNTLVCDFRPDCEDQSDERFCWHPPCKGFSCRNGQCVSYSMYCDGFSHCLDNSDEAECIGEFQYQIYRKRVTTPSLITLYGHGQFVHSPLNDTASCPDTHYLCGGESPYCLPVYTLCNGYYDCVDGDDEMQCDNVTCQGFYQCRDSAVCVHVDHLCDGWGQCPQGDDEWLCEEHPCPPGCLCHGLAFVCRESFPAMMFSSLRYLDGSGSNMAPTNFTYHLYLLYLVLADCGLDTVSELTLPNLLMLDLSNNLLQEVDMSFFVYLKKLKDLRLADNPLVSLYITQRPALAVKQTSLLSIDLSRTALTSFHTQALSSFVKLQRLNLSFAAVSVIEEEGFQHTSSLSVLDLSGCPIKYFPTNVFHEVPDLRQVFSPTYKLCCRSMFPAHVSFDERVCRAQKDEISSCDDLLRSLAYRVFLWIMSVLAIGGNVVCLVFRAVVSRKQAKGSFNIFVSNLCVSDFLMGVYIAIIGAADLWFRGTYLHNDLVWTNSWLCRLAGFLCLLSCEVSALVILLITLDRFIVLRFPFSTVRFKNRSTIAASVLTWLAGLVLAGVPLLPATSHWQFYSQTGICMPLPITRQDFRGRSYSFGVVIIFNFVLFMLVAVGQAVIYWSVRKNSMTNDTTKKSHMTVARRLITVALTDFLCWFPIGVCGLLALSDIPIPGEVNVAMAIFVLPLNSAFNPFLYTVNFVMEKRKVAYEERLTKMLEAVLHQEE